MLTRTDPRIDTSFGHALVKEGVVTAEIIDEALKRSTLERRPLVEILSQQNNVNTDLLYRLFARQLNLPLKNLRNFIVPQEVIERIPIKVASHYQFVPLAINDKVLTVAAHYPINLKTQDEIRLQIGLNVAQVLATKQDVVDVIRRSYGLAANTIDRIVTTNRIEKAYDDVVVNTIQSPDLMAADASVIHLVNEILLEAIHKRATDVHLEPFRGQFRLRYRIDGILHDANLSEKARKLILPIISRIKIMSNLDIVEHRLPQDGRAIIKIEGEKIDLRVSSIPTPVGESVVIRILKTEMTFDLDKLGLSPENADLVRDLILRPHGVILLTGPTGSGKTTTLYTCLNQIRSTEKKIISLEDPIEYEIPGITQIQVDPKVELSFARGLRSMLRHDPDIMMVGEIRDVETAEIAIRAALTGHLIFSTLHTNDAASGVARLMEIGVQPFLVASSVQSIIAQRLVRVICSKCKVANLDEENTIRHKIQKDLKLYNQDEIVTYKGEGCEACNSTGFFGRTAIHEILVLSESIKEMILKKASAQDIRAQALLEGMSTLLIDGWRKVLAGVTTTGEVISAASVGVIRDARI